MGEISELHFDQLSSKVAIQPDRNLEFYAVTQVKQDRTFW